MIEDNKEWVTESKFDMSLIKCSDGNKAKFLCTSQCKQSGLICSQQNQCKCSQNHKNCSFSILKNFINKIQGKIQKTRQIKKLNASSLKTYDSILVSMIDKLSLMRQNLFKLQDQFYLTQHEIKLIDILRKGKSNELTGNFVKNIQERSSVQSIASKQQIQLFWEQKKNIFNQFCQNLEKNCFININPIQMITFDQQNQLKVWLKQQTHKQVQSFNLIFRASQNQFSAKKFHQKCDKVKNTITIVKTQFKKIIGGFNPLKWEGVHKTFKHDQTHTSFLFSLNLNEKYKCFKYQNAIACLQNYGPSFGGYEQQQNSQKNFYNMDLIISDQANKNSKSFSRFSTTYNLQKKYKDNQQTWTAFTGQPDGTKFRVQQYLIYEVNFYQ